MDKHIIDTYFNTSYKLVDNKPKISIKLKSEFKLKPIPKLNGNSREYYLYYLGNEVGDIVFDTYRPLMAYHKRIEWYIDKYEPDNKFLREWLKEYEIKRVESVRETYKNGSFRDKFKIRVNEPSRIKRISTATKKMWQQARLSDPDKIRRMVHSNAKKSFTFDGISMNSIEFIMASLLSSLNLPFEYETVHTFQNKTYIPDFYIRQHNLIIECFGDYWHANPKYYNDNDCVFRHTVQTIHERDAEKQRLFTTHGYQYLYFWEHDLRNNLETIKEAICNTLKKK
jgi:very-short-patch-repair endonuclease